MSDVLVIGAGPNALIAATYLAEAGAEVTVLEASGAVGGVCANRIEVGDYLVPKGPHTFASLDPRVLKDLKLTRRLAFLERDLPMTVLGEGQSLTLSRDVHESQRGLVPVSDKDGVRYAAFRRDFFAFARAMRSLWWEDGSISDTATAAELRRLQVTSASALIEGTFDSDLARAAFAFDALAVNPSAPGSALVLAWQAAQEMCGLQGAVAIAAGGPQTLVDMLATAANAAGVVIRLNADVARFDLDGEAVRGAVLTSGEKIDGRTILSSLTRKKTLLEFLPPGAAGFAAARRLEAPADVGEAKLVLALKARPQAFARPARLLIGDKLETATLSHAEAEAGRLPSELFLEAVVLESRALPPEETHEVLLSVRIRPVPVAPLDGWKTASAQLIPAVVRNLEHHAPGLAASITGLAFVPPERRDALCLADMVAPWRTRIVTPVRGLYLCGASAEPVPCISGRAGRMAAAIVMEDWKESP